MLAVDRVAGLLHLGFHLRRGAMRAAFGGPSGESMRKSMTATRPLGFSESRSF